MAAGHYQNANEVLREGLRLVENREEEAAARLQALRAAVQTGMDDIEAGRFCDFTSDESLQQHLALLADQSLTDT